MSNTYSRDGYTFESHIFTKYIRPGVSFEWKIEDSKCLICRDPLDQPIEDNKIDIAAFPACKQRHFAHTYCIKRWFNIGRNNLCPLCKSKIKLHEK